MSKYEFAKRLKRMLNNECEITEMETHVARKCAKHYEQMTQLKTMLNKQEHELSRYRDEVLKIKKQTEKLEEFVASEEERLQAIHTNIERLRKEYEETEQQRYEQRKKELSRREFIHTIKKSTQMFFNEDALPHRFQGVSIQRTETSSEWKPFSVDAQQWLQFLEEEWQKHQRRQEDKENNANNRMEWDGNS
ncbi:spc25 [Musca autumnalis]|uniref:spc25 n=1 Tax=Musca autumnalis TaxID=221902 RepID=UPI003CF12325